MNDLGNIRSQGVRIPENQSTERAPEMTVTRATTGKWALVEYGDERGRKVTQLALIFGNKVFVLPDQGRWTEGWKPLNTKLQAQVLEMINAEPAPLTSQGPVVPPSDAVDVAPFDDGNGGKTG